MPEVLIHGHYAPATMLNNEAWGLSVFKNKNLYITSSVALPKVGKLKKSEWIEDLKFSPDNKYLVVSSHDNFLYLFDVPNF